jgi:hypothetical protein
MSSIDLARSIEFILKYGLRRWTRTLHYGQIASAPAAYDSMETKDLDNFATLAFMNETKGQQQNLQAERKV